MHYDFIEIGTADFDTEVEKCSNEAYGICVEPLVYYLDKLPRKHNIQYVNAAISDYDGFVDCFYIPESTIELYNLPWWLRGCSSIIDYHPTAKRILSEIQLNPKNVFHKSTVPVLSVKTLFSKYDISSVDFLKIDTEGHDCVILNNLIPLINDGSVIKRIQFESNVLTNAEAVDQVLNKLTSLGYKIVSRGENTIVEKTLLGDGNTI